LVATTTLGLTKPLSFTSTLSLSPSEITLTFWISAACVSVFLAKPGDTISISTQNRAKILIVCPLLTVVPPMSKLLLDYFRTRNARVVAVNQLSMMLWHCRQSVEKPCAW
jgi:hypothetical protein